MAPFVIEFIGQFDNVLYSFGIVLVAISLLVWRLDETKDLPLKDSIEEEADFHDNSIQDYFLKFGLV